MAETSTLGRSLFIADLHLTDERPDANGRFFHFLEHTANKVDALYILGDLFEVWIGDDDTQSAIAKQCAQHIRTLVDAGTPVYFMHGNRDFLLAQRYAKTSGMQLLADPTLLDLYSTPTLLMHGDTLCTDDADYQRQRRWIRQPWVLGLLRSLPLKLRHALASRARQRSKRLKTTKPYEVMDVNQNDVIQTMRDYAALRLIHGHTHRPAHHALNIDGQASERWVLPDWYEAGGYLACSPEGCQLLPLD